MENRISINPWDIKQDLDQVNNLLKFRIYTDPLILEEKIKTLHLKNTNYILRLLRSWGIDEEIKEINTINSN